MKKNELVFKPIIEKPNPHKMIYLSIRVDGKTKTRIDANINFEKE
jgi:hypothetical protein